MRIYCCTIRKRLHVLGPSISAARVSIDLSRWMPGLLKERQPFALFRAQSGSNRPESLV